MSNRITEKTARRQFLAAKLHGWLPAIIEAAETYNLLPEDIAAIGSRETNLDAKFLNTSGDNGHGFGLVQVDRRAFPAWVRDGRWHDARECFMKCAEILRANQDWLVKQAGQVTVVSDSKHNTRKFIMPHFDEATIRRISIAMYNGGRWCASNPSWNLSPDASTTGRDYSEDVLERAEWFDSFMGSTGLNNEQGGSYAATGEATESASIPAHQPAKEPATNVQASPSPIADRQPGEESRPAPSTFDSQPVLASMNERDIKRGLMALTGSDSVAALKEWLLGSKEHALMLFAIAALLFVAWLIYNQRMNKHRINVVSDQTRLNAV
jgi:hypothetical protein